MRNFILFSSIALAIATLPTNSTNAQARVNCDDPKSVQESAHCAGIEFQQADRRLNQTYARVLVRHNDQAALIRTAQRAWITYRDTECAVIGARFNGHPGRAYEIINCKMELTNEREARLTANYLLAD
ncbi:MAG: hypothetical protein FD163_122 [Hyphomonadaceae bacterium]|nr:MAG: hypothetical protein FD128_1079 [Hyphomonadaceae bacterium]KAF0186847.1 MAG: hypothetical protein FD163_122 [Hyphomonadaceae bacterium]